MRFEEAGGSRAREEEGDGRDIHRPLTQHGRGGGWTFLLPREEGGKGRSGTSSLPRHALLCPLG